MDKYWVINKVVNTKTNQDLMSAKSSKLSYIRLDNNGKGLFMSPDIDDAKMEWKYNNGVLTITNKHNLLNFKVDQNNSHEIILVGLDKASAISMYLTDDVDNVIEMIKPIEFPTPVHKGQDNILSTVYISLDQYGQWRNGNNETSLHEVEQLLKDSSETEHIKYLTLAISKEVAYGEGLEVVKIARKYNYKVKMITQ